MSTLDKFRTAHKSNYNIALQEIKNSKKQSHWMWYIFPQIAGLGRSETAKFYSIKEQEEAEAFLEDEILGKNLVEISTELLNLEGKSASQIFGYPDNLKLKSSMTLFSQCENAPDVFEKVLVKYFAGEKCQFTLNQIK